MRRHHTDTLFPTTNVQAAYSGRDLISYQAAGPGDCIASRIAVMIWSIWSSAASTSFEQSCRSNAAVTSCTVEDISGALVSRPRFGSAVGGWSASGLDAVEVVLQDCLELIGRLFIVTKLVL